MGLERAEIVRTAVLLLDEVGLDGLSLRRLASELGVQAPALYWHFKDKRELLDHMVAAVIGAELRHDLPAPGQAWDDWLTERTREFRQVLLSHRDGARLAAGNLPTADRFATIEQVLRHLTDAGFAPHDALFGLLALTNYTVGTAFDEQAGEENTGEVRPDPERFPTLTLAAGAVDDPDELFEQGLRFIIDGMRTRLSP